MKKTNSNDYWWPVHCTSIIICIMLALSTAGCADGVRELNTQIMESNYLSRIAYAEGMAACGDNDGCQVGLTAAYFSTAGQQQLVKPDTSLDYVKATLPFAQLGLQAFGMYWMGNGNGTSGDRASTYVKGDGNTFVMGNKLTSTDYASTSLTFTPSYTRTYDGGYNRNYTNQEPILTLEGTE